MRLHGALIQEQGVKFAILIVKPHVLSNPTERDEVQNCGSSLFGFVPIVLMAQDARGVPTYYGRKDIVNFLSRIHPSRIPWKEYHIS